mgnify:CR=1 FL=1
MELNERWEIIRAFSREYRQGTKNEKSLLLSYVEQQNYSVVRRFAGYTRIEELWQADMLNRLYQKLSDYQNFFQPVMRLKEKMRQGARLTRRYDKPKTEYQRLFMDPTITEETKQRLRQRFIRLNPRKLLMDITVLGRKLTRRRR